MTNLIKVEITSDEFYDVLFNPELVVVQKDINDHLSHTTYAYVYENNKPVWAAVREITNEGTCFWRETV